MKLYVNHTVTMMPSCFKTSHELDAVMERKTAWEVMSKERLTKQRQLPLSRPPKSSLLLYEYYRQPR